MFSALWWILLFRVGGLMKKGWIIFLLATILFADVKIIVPQECPIEKLSKKVLKQLFMGQKKSINGVKVHLFDAKDRALSKKFYRKFLDKSPTQIRIYWVRMLFTGRKRPPKRVDLQELSKMKTGHGCILTYVGAQQTVPGWKTVNVDAE